MGRTAIFCETWKSGGIESFLYNVLINSAEELINIDIITTQFSDSVFTDDLKKRGVNFIQLAGNNRNICMNYRMLKKIYKERCYDVVYLNVCHGVAYLYAYLARRCRVSRIIVHSHNTDLRQGLTKWIKLLLHWISVKFFESDSYEYWACSEAAAKFQFPAHTRTGKYEVIPNGIDIERFAFNRARREALRTQMGLTDRFVVGNVGRLCDQKNQLFIIDVFKELLKQRDNAYLILVGEGEDYEKICKKVHELHIDDKVMLYGVKNNVEELMWIMDCFLFPSKFEGLGIVAIEAQATGLKVLCSERVPKETKITEAISYIDLSEDYNNWIEELIDIPIGCRYDNSKEIRKAGFDIKDVSNKIMKEIIRKDYENKS